MSTERYTGSWTYRLLTHVSCCGLRLQVELVMLPANVFQTVSFLLYSLRVPSPDDSVDVVVMNPPFGTRSKGADMLFLAAGLKVSRSWVPGALEFSPGECRSLCVWHITYLYDMAVYKFDHMLLF